MFRTARLKRSTPPKKKFTKACRRIRGIMESPFGDVKVTFESLSKPFPEGEAQLGYLVTYALGIHNLHIKLKNH